MLCDLGVLVSRGISSPRFPQLSKSVVGCSDERFCHTGTPPTTSILQCRSIGTRVVEYGFGIAKNNKGCFFLCSSVFSIQSPAEVVSLLVQV